MCGFIGYYDCVKVPKHININSIVHRGPDNSSKAESDNWKVDFCRLAINDLSSNGNQPFKIGKIIAFVNGEIYNSKFLREKYFKEINFISNSDCEVIPYLYKKFGINFLEKLDGMFSIIIIDEELDKIYLIKDSFGKKPLYYTKSPFTFCSEARLFNENSEVNKENFINFFSYHFKFDDQTIFSNIKSIPPGSYLEYSKKKINIVNWYKPEIKIVNKNIKSEVFRLFKNSINKRLMSDVEIGVFLSGGMDSNFIVNTLNSLGEKKIKTFTGLVQDISNSQNSTDTKEEILKNSKNLSLESYFVDIDFKYINNNFVKLVCEMDHPIIDTGYIIAYALAEEAKKKNCKVIFSGIGGDECFGGYNWQDRYTGNHFFRNIIVSFFSKFSKYFVKYKNKYFNYLFFPYFLHLSSLSLAYFKNKDFNFYQTSKENTNKSINELTKKYKKYFKNDFRNYLDFLNVFGVMNHQLMTFDLACMKNSIENRSPFLDKEFIEYCLSISSKYKYKNKKLLGDIIKEYFPDTKFQKNEKSGPVINFAIFFDDKNILLNAKKFVLNNIQLIGRYISTEFEKKIKSNFTELQRENYRPLIALITVLIWIKYNLEKRFDKNITFLELLKHS